jgi:2-methylaconitate cis-trans-isomerase PrpF
VETIEVDADGSFNEDGDYAIPGVKGFGSEIKVAFVDPAGSMTGKLFPTGNRTDTIFVKDRNGPHFSVKATLIDVANPFVVVDASSLPQYLRSCPKEPTGYLEHMESIRRTGAVMMGLAPNVQAAAKVRGTPKLAIVSPPARKFEGTADIADVHVVAFSMGKPHPSLQLTGAACLASAVCIQGTVAHHAAAMNGVDADSLLTPERTPSPSVEDGESRHKGSSMCGQLLDQRTVRLSHASGSIDVEILASISSTVAVVERCIVSRTARRLFEGKVYYYE